VEALERVGGPDVSALVGWEPDEAIASIVRNWPARFSTARATALGLSPDESFEAIVRSYIASTRA
jgi:hypothetical protein